MSGCAIRNRSQKRERQMAPMTWHPASIFCRSFHALLQSDLPTDDFLRTQFRESHPPGQLAHLQNVTAHRYRSFYTFLRCPHNPVVNQFPRLACRADGTRSVPATLVPISFFQQIIIINRGLTLAPRSNTMQTPPSNRPPLGLPRGSIPGLLTLMIVAVVIAQLVRGRGDRTALDRNLDDRHGPLLRVAAIHSPSARGDQATGRRRIYRTGSPAALSAQPQHPAAFDCVVHRRGRLSLSARPVVGAAIAVDPGRGVRLFVRRLRPRYGRSAVGKTPRPSLSLAVLRSTSAAYLLDYGAFRTATATGRDPGVGAVLLSVEVGKRGQFLLPIIVGQIANLPVSRQVGNLPHGEPPHCVKK